MCDIVRAYSAKFHYGDQCQTLHIIILQDDKNNSHQTLEVNTLFTPLFILTCGFRSSMFHILKTPTKLCFNKYHS